MDEYQRMLNVLQKAVDAMTVMAEEHMALKRSTETELTNLRERMSLLEAAKQS